MENKTEAKAFLKDLRKELNTQETDCQASPRFWVIMDYRDEVTAEGHHDNVMLYDSNACHTYESLNDYFEDIEERLSDGDIDIDSDQIQNLEEAMKEVANDSTISIYDIQDIISMVGDDDCVHVVYTEKRSYIVPNTFFLTKKEAKDYLRIYGYNHTDKAHTYAMTAIRSPHYSKLLSIIETYGDKML